ncbi:MAG: hypothetical protein ACM3PT_04165 [Deltaproteobacteria bacterium]
MGKIGDLFSAVFGVLALVAGMVNIFWGNDPEFGVFIFLLAFIFFPFVTNFIFKKTGHYVHWLIKLLIALFIIWVVLGVGELFAKIEIMKTSLF